MSFKTVFSQPPIGLILAILLAAGLSACQSMGTVPIAPERRIALLPDGPHRGEADTGDLVVAYAYRLLPEPDRQIQISGGIRSERTRGDMTNLYVNFVDDTGRVLARKILYGSGYKKDVLTPRPSTFDTTLPLPPNAAAIAFSSYVQTGTGHK